MKFKVGDRIKIPGKNRCKGGCVARITEINNSGYAFTDACSGEENTHCLNPDELKECSREYGLPDQTRSSKSKKIKKIDIEKVYSLAMKNARSSGNADYRVKKALADKINEIIDKLERGATSK